MIIYYHCNSDNALLLSFLLSCHPYIHPFSFHDFYTCPTSFLHQESVSQAIMVIQPGASPAYHASVLHQTVASVIHVSWILT